MNAFEFGFGNELDKLADIVAAGTLPQKSSLGFEARLRSLSARMGSLGERASRLPRGIFKAVTGGLKQGWQGSAAENAAQQLSARQSKLHKEIEERRRTAGHQIGASR